MYEKTCLDERRAIDCDQSVGFPRNRTSCSRARMAACSMMARVPSPDCAPLGRAGLGSQKSNTRTPETSWCLRVSRELEHLTELATI